MKSRSPPVIPKERLINNSKVVLLGIKPFDWFCHECTQPLSGIYEMLDVECVLDFPECRTCGIFGVV
jgi:hypothetical protein